MITNADCTIYRRVRTAGSNEFSWIKQYVKECWWFEDTRADMTTNGLKSADILTVRIPDLTVEVSKDDYIVRGNCRVNMQTVKDLEGLNYYKVTKANYNSFGRNPHIKVVGV